MRLCCALVAEGDKLDIGLLESRFEDAKRRGSREPGATCRADEE